MVLSHDRAPGGYIAPVKSLALPPGSFLHDILIGHFGMALGELSVPHDRRHRPFGKFKIFIPNGRDCLP